MLEFAKGSAFILPAIAMMTLLLSGSASGQEPQAGPATANEQPAETADTSPSDTDEAYDDGNGVSGPIQSIGLEQALVAVIENNPQIIAGDYTIEAAIALRKQMRANFLPQFTVDLTAMYYSEKPGFGSFGSSGFGDPTLCSAMDEPDEQLFCSGLFSAFGAMTSGFESKQYDVKVSLTMVQPLTPLYQAYHGYKLAELGVDVAKIEQEKTKADLRMKTVEAYYGYLKAKAAITAMDEAITVTEAHVAKAKAFFEAEYITKNDLLQAQTRLAQMKGQKLQVEHGLEIAQEALLLLLDEPPGTPIAPADQSELEAAFLQMQNLPSKKQAIETALENRPELTQMKTLVKQASQAVKLAKGGYIPTVAAFATYQHEEGSVIALPPLTVGANLSWNFWDWGKVYFTVDEAEARAAAALAGKKALERAIKFEVKQALLAVELTEKEIEIQKEALVAAEEQLRIEKDRYEQKVNTSTEVLDAQARLVQAQIEYAVFSYDHLVSIAKLRKAMGTL